MKLRALIVPDVNDVLQIWDGEFLKALLQEVQHLVPGQSLHLCQVLGEDLDRKRNYYTRLTELTLEMDFMK